MDKLTQDMERAIAGEAMEELAKKYLDMSVNGYYRSRKLCIIHKYMMSHQWELPISTRIRSLVFDEMVKVPLEDDEKAITSTISSSDPEEPTSRMRLEQRIPPGWHIQLSGGGMKMMDLINLIIEVAKDEAIAEIPIPQSLPPSEPKVGDTWVKDYNKTT